MSLNRAARHLGLAPRRLREAVRRGELVAYQPGHRTVYIQWYELKRWLRTQRVASLAEDKSETRGHQAEDREQAPAFPRDEMPSYAEAVDRELDADE